MRPVAIIRGRVNFGGGEEEGGGESYLFEKAKCKLACIIQLYSKVGSV